DRCERPPRCRDGPLRARPRASRHAVRLAGLRAIATIVIGAAVAGVAVWGADGGAIRWVWGERLRAANGLGRDAGVADGRAAAKAHNGPLGIRRAAAQARHRRHLKIAAHPRAALPSRVPRILASGPASLMRSIVLSLPASPLQYIR